MTVDLLRQEGFLKVGAFGFDEAHLIIFVPLFGAPRHKNVLYAYVHDGRVAYFGETSGSAIARNLAVASDTRRKVLGGRPLVGAAWQLFEAVERRGTVEVWAGPRLNDASSKMRKHSERSHMVTYGTVHPNGWNDYPIASET